MPSLHPVFDRWRPVKRHSVGKASLPPLLLCPDCGMKSPSVTFAPRCMLSRRLALSTANSMSSPLCPPRLRQTSQYGGRCDRRMLSCPPTPTLRYAVLPCCLSALQPHASHTCPSPRGRPVRWLDCPGASTPIAPLSSVQSWQVLLYTPCDLLSLPPNPLTCCPSRFLDAVTPAPSSAPPAPFAWSGQRSTHTSGALHMTTSPQQLCFAANSV